MKSLKQKPALSFEARMVRPLIALVVENHDRVAFVWLIRLLPRVDWEYEIARVCREMSKPLPFASLLTYPGHAPTWPL